MPERPAATYIVRNWRDDDAQALSDICRSAISVIGPHAYTTEQVAAWLARHPEPQRYGERVADGATILVAAGSDDQPAAYSLTERDGHLDHLYCHPDHTRQGLAERLLSASEALVREWGVSRLYTEASDLARPAFERAGYVMTHKREFAIDGVPIHNWAMEKALT